MESVETLTQKLMAAYGTQHQLERLRQRAVPKLVRVLEGARTVLPLSLIPASLVWTAVVFFLPFGDTMELIRLYAIGLLTLMLTAGFLLMLRFAVTHLRLRDEFLGELTLIPGLAYHPNTALRRRVAARGYATLAEFQQWYDKQREILETRVSDFDAALHALKRSPAAPRNLDQYAPGARLFLQD
jgi:hypothetical protein